MRNSTTRLPGIGMPVTGANGAPPRRRAIWVAIAAACGCAAPVGAEPADSAPALEEVVVTATRREQSIQDVAISVSAVTGEQIEKMKLFRFEDIASMTPGLSMANTPSTGASINMRGIGFSTYSSAEAAVDVYVNELPMDAVYAFNSMFDVEQVEVLRGPQGTLRGRPAPAGAVTLTTRRPDLDRAGFTVNGSISDANGRNLLLAGNLPVIGDTLAVRVAGYTDANEGSGGRNLGTGKHEDIDTDAVRLTLLWKPVDALSVLLTHQHMEVDNSVFDLVDGSGAGYNGPAIDEQDLRGVMEGTREISQKIRVTSLNVSWDLEVARLTYIGGYQDLENVMWSDLDGTNAIADYAAMQLVDTGYKVNSQELRLESTGERSWDYTLGLWFNKTKTRTLVEQTSELTGAFGDPGLPVTSGPVDPDYLLGVGIDIPTESTNYAIFGNTVFHLGDATDLSVGARYFKNESKRSQTLSFTPGLNAVGIAPGVPLDFLAPGFCPFVLNAINGLDWVRENYTGYCDLRISVPTFYQPADRDDTAWVYNASLSHALSDDVMVYVAASHSWRPPGVTVGITAQMPDDLLFGGPEKSNEFEVGIKSEWLDGRMRLNATAYYQEFDGFIGRFENVPYNNPASGQITSGGFTYNADAVVKGAEAELFALLAPHWTAQLAVSVQDGKYDDASVPCRDTDFDGHPDGGANPLVWGAAGPVAFCSSDDPISALPDWNLVLQSEYVLPRGGVEFYLRGLLNYAPDNDNVQTYFERDAFAIVNMFTGVRSADGGWDVTLWVKNLFDDNTVLDSGQAGSYAGVVSGYSIVLLQHERELGLSLRYSLGSG